MQFEQQTLASVEVSQLTLALYKEITGNWMELNSRVLWREVWQSGFSVGPRVGLRNGDSSQCLMMCRDSGPGTDDGVN